MLRTLSVILVQSVFLREALGQSFNDIQDEDVLDFQRNRKFNFFFTNSFGLLYIFKINLVFDLYLTLALWRKHTVSQTMPDWKERALLFMMNCFLVSRLVRVIYLVIYVQCLYFQT